MVIRRLYAIGRPIIISARKHTIISINDVDIASLLNRLSEICLGTRLLCIFCVFCGMHSLYRVIIIITVFVKKYITILT